MGQSAAPPVPETLGVRSTAAASAAARSPSEADMSADRPTSDDIGSFSLRGAPLAPALAAVMRHELAWAAGIAAGAVGAPVLRT